MQFFHLTEEMHIIVQILENQDKGENKCSKPPFSLLVYILPNFSSSL